MAQLEYNGHQFDMPDDATQEEIYAFLDSGEADRQIQEKQQTVSQNPYTGYGVSAPNYTHNYSSTEGVREEIASNEKAKAIEQMADDIFKDEFRKGITLDYGTAMNAAEKRYQAELDSSNRGGIQTLAAIGAAPFTAGMSLGWAVPTMAGVEVASGAGYDLMRGREITPYSVGKDAAIGAAGEVGGRIVGHYVEPMIAKKVMSNTLSKSEWEGAAKSMGMEDTANAGVKDFKQYTKEAMYDTNVQKAADMGPYDVETIKGIASKLTDDEFKALESMIKNDAKKQASEYVDLRNAMRDNPSLGILQRGFSDYDAITGKITSERAAELFSSEQALRSQRARMDVDTEVVPAAAEIEKLRTGLDQGLRMAEEARVAFKADLDKGRITQESYEKMLNELNAFTADSEQKMLGKIRDLEAGTPVYKEQAEPIKTPEPINPTEIKKTPIPLYDDKGKVVGITTPEAMDALRASIGLMNDINKAVPDARLGINTIVKDLSKSNIEGMDVLLNLIKDTRGFMEKKGQWLTDFINPKVASAIGLRESPKSIYQGRNQAIKEFGDILGDRANEVGDKTAREALQRKVDAIINGNSQKVREADRALSEVPIKYESPDYMLVSDINRMLDSLDNIKKGNKEPGGILSAMPYATYIAPATTAAVDIMTGGLGSIGVGAMSLGAARGAVGWSGKTMTKQARKSLDMLEKAFGGNIKYSKDLEKLLDAGAPFADLVRAVVIGGLNENVK